MFACILIRAARAAPQDHATSDALLQALTPFDQADVQGHWANDQVLMVQALTWNTPQSRHERTPEVCAATGRVIASWVRLDNRDDLCIALGLHDAPELTDPQIVLAAHRQWGADCVDRLEGDFSFVIHDPESNDVFCARDSMGARPFYYVLTDEVFMAATALPVFHALASPFATVSQKWMALFVAQMNWCNTETPFQGVSKLAAAHHMTVRRDAALGPTRYFAFDLSTTAAARRDPIWVERYRDAFDRAVADRARSAYLVGTESSGGLDSSSIAARLAQVLPHSPDDFHCFGMVEQEHEPALALATAAHCAIRHSHIQTKQEKLRLDDAFHRALRMIGHPPEHGQMLLHPFFFELAAHLDIRTMLSGFGGDELVTSQARELWLELQARKAYPALFQELPGNAVQRLARLGLRLKRGLPDPFEAERDRIRRKLIRSCLRDDALADMGLLDQAEIWVNPGEATPSMNTWAGLMPQFNFGRTARMESGALFAASYGIEYRWPLLDRRLAQQYFATPSIEKRHRDMGRYLHRRAMEGRIPERIQWQRSKYMGPNIGGDPNVEKRRRSDISDLPGALRDLVDARKFDSLVARARQHGGHTAAPDNFAIMELWQVDQLVEWLNGEGAGHSLRSPT